jgi:protoheme ferro-lyase
VTLEEIAIRYASLYRSHGGGELGYIPASNDSPGHIKALVSSAAPSSSGLGARSAYLLRADAG